MEDGNKESGQNMNGKASAGAAASKALKSGNGKESSVKKKVKFRMWLIIGSIFLTFTGAHIRTHFWQIYFQGLLGFDSAQEYADVSMEADTVRIKESVEAYYADEDHYNAAMDKAQELIDQYIEETDAHNEETFENYTGDNHELGEAERNVNSAEELFGNGGLQKYIASYVMEYASQSQIRAIEKGGAEADSTIAELEGRLLGMALEVHTQWLCTSDTMQYYEEERGTGQFDANGVEITETWRIYYNTYEILLYNGQEQKVVDGVEWDTSTEAEDEDIILELIDGEENGDTSNLKDGLKSYHGSGISSRLSDDNGETATASVIPHETARVGGLIDDIKGILSDIFEYFVQELFTLKERGPVPKVTTLQYGSSAYTGSSYMGNTAALAAIEQYRNCQYAYGGLDPQTGIDCSALIYLSYRDVGYMDIERTSANQRSQCIMLNQYWSYEEWNSIKMPGDLILLSGHVAMYVGTTEDMRNYGVSEDIIREEGLADGVEYCLEASKKDCDGPGDGVKFSTLQSNIGGWRFLGCGRPYDTTSFGISGDAESLYRFFISAGMTPEAASGLVGNLSVENGAFNPTVISKAGYFGLAQWSPSRKANLIRYCQGEGFDYQSVNGQANFIVFEMRTSYTGLWEHLKHCPNASLAAQDICLSYEGAVTDNPRAGFYQGDFSPSQKGKQRLQALADRIRHAEEIYSSLAH